MGGAKKSKPVVKMAQVEEQRPNGLQNFQEAAVVIGQRDFGKRESSTTPGRGTIRQPYGDPAVYNGALYLPDLGGNRILGFNQVPVANGASADFVLGQTSFSGEALGNGRDQMRAPLTVRMYDGKMFVVDHFNHRILIWNQVPVGQTAADVVVGQREFGVGALGSCSASNLYVPFSLYVVAGKLLVSDSYHHRVLIWNSIPSGNGAPADMVLGQPNLSTCAVSGPSAQTLSYPGDLWSDGTRLIVADPQNHRVLIWNTFPTENQAPADVVLGQRSMTTRVVGTAPGSLRRPLFLTSSGEKLFVSDHGNHRVLFWNSMPTGNGAPADGVLGQSDFTHSSGNDDDQDGVPDSAPSARTFSGPTGLHVFQGALLVGDKDNDRYLVFKIR